MKFQKLFMIVYQWEIIAFFTSTLDDVPENSFNDGTFNNDTLTSSIGKNSKFLSDLTPPVTPDSTPMSIGNSPNFRQQTSFLSLSQRNTIAANIKKVCITTYFE